MRYIIKNITTKNKMLKERVVKKICYIILCFALILSLVGCSNINTNDNNMITNDKNDEQESDSIEHDKHVVSELMVYCGAGLKKPMEEIGNLYLEEKNVQINYVFGGSGTLISQLETIKMGDVLVLGSIDTIDIAEKKGIIHDYSKVAYHVPVIGVELGNPLNIKTVEDFKDKNIRVILGDEKANAIGRSSLKIFENYGIDINDVNIVAKTSTVNEIGIQIGLGNGDACILTKDQLFGREDVESVPIDEELNSIEIIPIGVCSYSENAEISSEFIDFVISDKGKQIFEKFGFDAYED